MNAKFFPLLLFFAFCWSTTQVYAKTPFQRMDQDFDQRLSRSEFKGAPKIFTRLDRNSDGYISLQEAEGTKLVGRRERTQQVENVSQTKLPTKCTVVDTHNHLVGRKVRGTYDFTKQAEIALQSMDAAGVKYNFLLPMPQAVNQKLRLTLEDLLPVAKKYPDRFMVLGGGGSLNVMIQQAIQEGKVTKAMEQEFDARALEIVEKGAVGFGEMTTEHFSMSKNHPYETAQPDHPLFLRLADLAAKYNMPIDLHMEAIPEKMPIPVFLKSPPNPQHLVPNIEAFSRLLAHNRNANIIWVHLGWDNTGKRTVALTRRLLQENPNLYMSIRIAKGMRDKHVAKATFPLDANGKLKQAWLALFEEFPDRFFLGSDEIIKVSNDHPSAGSIQSTVALLDQLPDMLREKIGYENVSRLYNRQVE